MENDRQEQQEGGYKPRPKQEVWLTRIGLVVFVVFVIYQIVAISRGGL